MSSEFTLKIADWINTDIDGLRGFRNLKAKIDFLAEVLYNEYLPTRGGAHGEFRHRLAKWIRCASTEDQKKLMFLLLEHLFFIGRREMEALYLTAYSRNVATWLLVKEEIQIDQLGAESRLKNAFSKTLFTAVTDSLNLGDFLRINNVQGSSFRYCWEQGLTEWDQSRFITSMGTKTRIVLLEDFVGSGSQMSNAVKKACSLPQRPDVLLCPLVICPDGCALAKTLMSQFPNLSFAPALELEPTCFVAPTPTPGEPLIFAELRLLVKDLHPAVAGTIQWDQNYGPYGFCKMGGLVVKHDNCPDNTLPIIHHASDTPWHPLFLRNSRLPL